MTDHPTLDEARKAFRNMAKGLTAEDFVVAERFIRALAREEAMKLDGSYHVEIEERLNTCVIERRHNRARAEQAERWTEDQEITAYNRGRAAVEADPASLAYVRELQARTEQAEAIASPGRAFKVGDRVRYAFNSGARTYVEDGTLTTMERAGWTFQPDGQEFVRFVPFEIESNLIALPAAPSRPQQSEMLAALKSTRDVLRSGFRYQGPQQLADELDTLIASYETGGQ